MIARVVCLSCLVLAPAARAADWNAHLDILRHPVGVVPCAHPTFGYYRTYWRPFPPVPACPMTVEPAVPATPPGIVMPAPEKPVEPVKPVGYGVGYHSNRGGR